MKRFHIFLLFLATFCAVGDAAVCQDGWRIYKDELCVKAFTEFLPFDEANNFCRLQSTETSQSTLVIVKEAELQELLADYTHDSFDNLWLGSKYDADSAQYKWLDGEPLTYTNWQDAYPTNVTDPQQCIELRPANARFSLNTGGKWANAVCQKRNLVMCQREASWTLEEAIDEIKRMRKQHQEDIDALTETIEKNQQTIISRLDNLQSSMQQTEQKLADSISAVDQRLSNSVADLEDRLGGTITLLDTKLTGSITALDQRLSGSISVVDTKLAGSIGTVDQRVTSTISELNALKVSAVKDIRLSGYEAKLLWKSAGSPEASGFVITGIVNHNQDEYVDTAHRRKLEKLVDGKWIAVSYA